MDYLLGIDIGTESSRAILFDLNGKAVASAQYPYQVHWERPGWASQDPEVWWETTVANCRSVMERAGAKPHEVIGIGVCGQMHAPVAVGADGHLLPGRVQIWCDKRCEPQCGSVMKNDQYEKLVRLAANPAAPSWMGFKIKWLKENLPEIYHRADTFLSPKDFINYRLTGERRMDLSEASGTFLLEASTCRWSEELAAALDIDIRKMPALAQSGEVIGRLKREPAKILGLAEGIPVVAGGGDMLCLLLGAGLTVEGRGCDIAGTACDISVFAPRPCLEPRLMNLHHVVPGWITFGILDSGGSSYTWLRDNLCEPQVDLARSQGRSPYEVLNELAAGVAPGAEGLLYLPYLMGERTLGSAYSRGVFFGLSLVHTRAHLVRAVLEGITFDLKQSLEIMTGMGIKVQEIRFIGGGARSPLWAQIKADLYDTVVRVVEEYEGGALGAALLAGVGAGIYPSAEEAAERVVKIKQEFSPRPEAAAKYRRYYKVFKELHDSLQPLFVELHRAATE